MYRIIFIFLSFLYGIEIDTNITLSKDDTKNRLILAKYYFDKNITKSKNYLEEIVNIDKNNSTAKNLLQKINLKEELNNISSNVDEFYKKMFFNQEYDKIKQFSKYLKVINSDYPKIITAKIYFWDGDYKKTKKILKTIKDKTSLDYVYIMAYMNYYEGKYKQALKYFSILYNATYKKEYAYKLIDIYILLNKIEKANKLISLLKPDKQLNSLKQKINKKITQKIDKLKQIYQKTHKFEDLQKLVSLLFSLNKQDEAYNLLEEYIKNHPDDDNAKYWYATYLSWDGDNKKALKVLEDIVEDGDYKVKLLIAKIYSWNGEYKKSINYLNDIIANCDDKEIVIDAKLTKGLIYFWQKDYEKAKPLLKEVLSKKPSIEAKEALMVIDGNIKPLIKKYKLLSRKSPTNLEYLLRVAQYSEMIKDIDTAIEYYEKYYNLKPLPKIAHSLAKLYLLKKNYYKAFSYYEYWAYQKGDEDSLYELAKNYYYSGYSKSALSVIRDILAINKKHKKALKLKAKILKYSPKFTQENSKKTISDIFNEKNSKLLSMANRLYFNGFYDEASSYYKEYILNNPEDNEIRERYAYSLEFSGKYKEASGEFFLLTWYKKDCNILYHYGFCLEKSKKTKLAKKAYKEALNYAKKPLPKFLKEFILEWKKAWESQDINRYKKFYISKYSKNPIWVIKKENIFNKVKFISLYLVGFTLIDSYKKGNKNYYKVKFYQQYTTNKKSDKGYKILLIECKDNNCKIAKESWQAGEYIPTNYRCYNLASSKITTNTTISMKNLLKNHKAEILLDKSNKKALESEDEVFTKFKVIKENNISIPHSKPSNTSTLKSKSSNLNSQLGLKGYYYEDKEKIKLIDYGIYYKNNTIYMDISKWRLWQNSKKRDGKYFTFHKTIDKFILGVEVGEYEKYGYLYPYIEYQDNINLKYFHSITGKDKKSFCGVDNNLTTKHFVISQYKGIKSDYLELTDMWWSVDFSKIDNNLEITPQFQYLFYNKDYKKIENYFYISGWYQYNSKTIDCYYSPDLIDSTFLEFHPIYKKLEGILKLGYSFIGDSFLYSYGFNYTEKYFDIGCMKNHSYKDSISNYWYSECKMDIRVKW